uniref:Uncharacterized protein y4pE/y4sA n=1 Tax=Talaromyces marneffei PM1 TaxID=1077442 RepID=A0A093X9Y0_TALMA
MSEPLQNTSSLTPAIPRLIKRRNATSDEKISRMRISLNRSQALRDAYTEDIQQFAAEDLIFLDESIFNEKTGWRQHAYSAVGEDAEIEDSINRGSTWSICAAMTLDGYLPCTGVKKGYFSAENFAEWLTDKLLPAVNALQRYPMVIILDNVAIHTQEQVHQIIEEAGHIIRYLPPYSPDFNPIELTFLVLKAWMKRNWIFLRMTFANYGDFLTYSIGASGCDRFARKQFKHAANGVYIEEEELIQFKQFLDRYEVDNTLDLPLD